MIPPVILIPAVWHLLHRRRSLKKSGPHLSLRKRLHLDSQAHRHFHRHVFGVLLGIGVMLLGSHMAAGMQHPHAIPVAIWDALAYFLHGIGTLPIMKHIEPLWLFLIQEELEA